MTMVLHHVHAERAIAEAGRVLTPGGVLLILGFGRYGGLRDAPHELRDVVTHRVVSRRMRAWDPPSVRADPRDTWADSRAMVRNALPGCTYRRLPMWRYLGQMAQATDDLSKCNALSCRRAVSGMPMSGCPQAGATAMKPRGCGDTGLSHQDWQVR